MNNAEFLTSLSPEQSAAFVSVRDELLAANQVAMGEITKANADEIAGLNASLKSATDKAAAAQVAQKAAEDALSSFRQTARTFLQQFGSVNHPDVAALVQAGAAELAKPDNQRKAEQLDAEIAAKQAERAKLNP